MNTSDEVLCVAAAHHLGALPWKDWPRVAAQLVAIGCEGNDLFTLSSLPGSSSEWVIEELVPGALADAGVPSLTDEQAAEAIARLVSQVTPPGGHPIIASLAKIADRRPDPGSGLIGQAHTMRAHLKVSNDATPTGHQAADAFEARLRSLPPMNLPLSLAQILARSL
ncbi:MAG: hypothetical protein JW722_08110 [Demequinaceae bacterium]|nr:hypothetical protein [Demequinaceae bacterium]